MSVRTLNFMLLVMWLNTCTRTIKTAFLNNCSCKLFGPNALHTEWNLPFHVCYHLSVEQLVQIWERGTDDWLNQHTLFPMKDGGSTCGTLREYTKRALLNEANERRKTWGRTFLCCVFMLCSRRLCVPLSILGVSAFFADCDNNSDYHFLLGITERESVMLPFGRSFITVMLVFVRDHNTHAETYTQTCSERIAQACQGSNILIQSAKTGLLISLASAV